MRVVRSRLRRPRLGARTWWSGDLRRDGWRAGHVGDNARVARRRQRTRRMRIAREPPVRAIRASACGRTESVCRLLIQGGLTKQELRFQLLDSNEADNIVAGLIASSAGGVVLLPNGQRAIFGVGSPTFKRRRGN